MKRVTTMTDRIKNEAEVEEDNMKVKKNKSKAESIIYIIGMGPGRGIRKMQKNRPGSWYS